jgi:hypothetical protein
MKHREMAHSTYAAVIDAAAVLSSPVAVCTSAAIVVAGCQSVAGGGSQGCWGVLVN